MTVPDDSAQTVVLLKEVPPQSLIDQWHEDGIVRASMVVDLGCYAWIGFVPLSQSATFRSSAMEALSASCNMPDPSNCTMAEIIAWFERLSSKEPMANIAFLVVTVQYGQMASFAANTIAVSRELGGRAYVAGAYAIGCGSFTDLVEVMADDYATLGETIRRIADIDGVLDVRALRASDHNARDFGRTL